MRDVITESTANRVTQAANITLKNNNAASKQKQRPILTYTENDRMAGSVAVWKTPESGKDHVAAALTHAQSGDSVTKNGSFHAMAFAGQTLPAGPEPFGAGDLLDMVNPLHHLPLVGEAYREITGDTIKPISRIIGGAVFGGGAGAGTALADTIIRHETGRDMGGHAMAFVRAGEMPRLHYSDRSTEIQDSPLLGVSDLRQRSAKNVHYTYEPESRTAGTMPRIDPPPLKEKLPIERDAVKRVELAPMPPARETLWAKADLARTTRKTYNS